MKGAKKQPKKKTRKAARRPLHRITTLVLCDVLTERGWKWRLMSGKTVLWSRPITGKGALSRDDAVAKARGYLLRHGYSTLLDRTGANCLPDVGPKPGPGAYFNTKVKR